MGVKSLRLAQRDDCRKASRRRRDGHWFLKLRKVLFPPRAPQGAAGGRLLTDDELQHSGDGAAGQGEAGTSSGGSGHEQVEDSEDEMEEPGGSPEGREIRWGILPEGLHVADKPVVLDASLIGQLIYMRWNAPHGWLVGTIKEKFDGIDAAAVQEVQLQSQVV